MVEKQVEKYHFLVSPISDKVYIGTIRNQKSKKLGKSYCISENKVDRTSEFNSTIYNMYKNSTWRITGEEPIHCLTMDKATLEKNKDKTIGEIFVNVVTSEVVE